MNQTVRWALLASIGYAAFCGAPALAEPEEDLAAKFAERPQILDISLSPKGNRVAYVSPQVDAGVAVYVVDYLAGGVPKLVLGTARKDQNISSCKWASEEKLVCRAQQRSRDVDGTLIGTGRVFAVNADGSGTEMLSARESTRSHYRMHDGGSVIDYTAGGTPGTILMTRQWIPDASTGTRMSNSREGLGIEAIDLATGKRRTFEAPRLSAVDYITDGEGDLRIFGLQPTDSTGYSGKEIRYSYRKSGSKSWEELGKLVIEGQGFAGFNPVSVDKQRDVVFGFDDKDGRRALFSVALDGSMERKLLVFNDTVDVDDLMSIGRRGRVVGASYATDYRHTVYFDAELKALGTALEKALPGDQSLTFLDANDAEDKLLVVTGADTDPGTYYVFDKASRQMIEVLPARPAMEGVKLGEMKPIRYPAGDGTMIPGYLTLPPGSDGKNLPAIVMPHGGPSSRDEWGFDWLSQYFASQGFAVLQPNYRGSSGFGSEWYRKNGFQSWRTAIGDVNDAGRWLTAQGIAAPGKLAIVGWSYGGYAALQSPVLDAGVFKAIVAVAPVTDLEKVREESRNLTNFRFVDAMIGNGPHVREGSPLRNIDAITAPVLLFHGTEDQNVGVAQSRAINSKLREAGKSVEYVEFPDLDHSLNDAAARTRLLTESNAFLRAKLGF